MDGTDASGCITSRLISLYYISYQRYMLSPKTMPCDALPILSGRPTITTADTSQIYYLSLSMSLENQPYEELCSNIRARPIGWDGYHRLHIITADELEKIKAIDKVSLERQVAIVEGDLEAYAESFLGDGTSGSGILGRAAGSRGGADTSIIQYILVLMGDLLESGSRWALFSRQPSQGGNTDTWVLRFRDTLLRGNLPLHS